MLTHWWRLAAVPLVLLTAELMVLVVAMPASAALTAGVGALTLPAVVTSHAPQTTTGRCALTVTERASALIYSGPNQGTNIPAVNLAIVSLDTPTAASGQPVDPVNGHMVPATSPAGPLDNARMVLHANSGYGAGTYTSTITTTIGSGQ